MTERHHEEDHNDGLRFHGLLPVAVTPLADAPTDALLAVLNGSNEALLAGLRTLHEKPETEDNDQNLAEIRRLDHKLSLVLDLLSMLLQQTHPLPPTQQVVLDSRHLQLAGPLPPADCYRLDLYLESTVAKPLRLLARPAAAMTEPTPTRAAGAPALVTLEFIGVGQQVRDGLDRFLFRQHRKQVAQRHRTP